MEVWGSWQGLEHELNRRRIVDEGLYTHLKKRHKHQTRKDIEFEVNIKRYVILSMIQQYLYWEHFLQMFGGRRVSLVRGSAKVVLLAIAR